MPEQQDGPRTSPGGEHNTPSGLAFLNIALLAIAAYNTLELLICIFHFFKRRRGLYFWSILICTLSVALFALAAFLQYFHLAPFAFTGVVIAITFPSLLVAQSLILYSRLHLISTPGTLLRFIFWGIIVTSILFLTPFAISLIGLSAGNPIFAPPHRYIERYMVTGHVVREVLICGLYLYQAVRQLRPIIEMKGTAGRRVMAHIMLVNGAVIILDLFNLLTLYRGRSGLGSAYTCVSHSVKLRMEFVVLNSLLELLGAPMNGHGGGVGWETGDGSRIEMVHERERGERRYAPAHQGDWPTVPGRTWGGDNSRGSV
ncbi:hypothetical protein BJX68DRAFT_262340 [Aspergillus pseudodeflectus]|uniref:DUF7703 domain-containing protein n=1 Tax=Aspergillus pseudodeflectus TaxID=176178 RepID=A0ABR4L2S6_9EURO